MSKSMFKIYSVFIVNTSCSSQRHSQRHTRVANNIKLSTFSLLPTKPFAESGIESTVKMSEKVTYHLFGFNASFSMPMNVLYVSADQAFGTMTQQGSRSTMNLLNQPEILEKYSRVLSIHLAVLIYIEILTRFVLYSS